jgi:hypothetical protein
MILLFLFEPAKNTSLAQNTVITAGTLTPKLGPIAAAIALMAALPDAASRSQIHWYRPPVGTRKSTSSVY